MRRSLLLRSVVAALGVVAMVAIPTPARAAIGDPDPSFGGAVTPGVGDEFVPAPGLQNTLARGMVVQTDGRIVVNTDRRLARYLANGHLDTSFDGSILGATREVFDTPVLDPAGRILVSTASPVVELVRLLPNGAIDATFGVGGFATFAPPGLTALAGAPGQIIVSGDASITVAHRFADTNMVQKTAIARFRPDGTLDPTFANGLLTSVDGRALEALSQLSDGRLLGLVRSTSTAWIRLLPNGALDTSFGPSGERAVTIPGTFGGGDAGRGIAIRPDGSVLLATSVGLVRFTPALEIDTAFGPAGSGGIARAITPWTVVPWAVSADASSIVVAADSEVYRFDQNGIADAAFVAGGPVVDPTPGDQVVLRAVVTPLGIVGLTPSHLVRWQAKPGFSLVVTPGSLQLGSNESGVFTARINRDAGFAAQVGLTFESPRAGITIAPASAALFSFVTSASPTVSVDATVPPGTYAIKVRATAVGQPPIEKFVMVTVPPCGVRISASSTMLAPGGATQQIGVTIVRNSTCQGPAALSITGLPPTSAPLGSGIGTSFSPNATSGSTSTLSIHALRFATPADSLQAQVRATIGTATYAALLSIEVVDLH